MIHSLFIINTAGDIVLEKHYRQPLGRQVLDPFFQAQTTPGESLAPAIAGVKHYLINVLRNDLYFVAIVDREVPPLLVIELLHRVVDTFGRYFGKVNEGKIQRESVVAFRVLEEMLDNGFPLVTELNILEDMVPPPAANMLDSVVKSVTKRKPQDALPTGQLTATQWRRANCKYSTNECFLDFVEELTTVVDKRGAPVTSLISGKVNFNSKLSGMPDLLLCLENSRLIDDISFHPCIRLARWSSERVLSFIPPDGDCTLATYTVRSMQHMPLPLSVQSTIKFAKTGPGKVDIRIGSKSNIDKPADDVVAKVVFPKSVAGVSLTSSYGTWSFDQITKTLTWELRRVPQGDMSTLQGTVTLSSGESVPDGAPPVLVDFKITGYAMSGVKVARLDIFHETYKAYKGVKYHTIAGNYEVRSS